MAIVLLAKVAHRLIRRSHDVSFTEEHTSTSRKIIIQDHQQSKKVGDKQTDKQANKRRLIEKTELSR